MNLKPLSARTCFLLILLFGLLAYSNTFSSSFQFDDSTTILGNRALYPLDLGKLWDFCPPRFIPYLSFAFNIYLAGFATWSFHVFNLLIHILTSFVVFSLTRSILNTPSLKDRVPSAQQNLFALVAALLFTIHPVQTQAVTYIVQRVTSMATLFYLATLWMYLKARLENTRYYWAVCFFLLAALFTKEICFTLPFALLLSELFFFPSSAKDPFSKKLLRWIPFAACPLIIPLFYLMNANLRAVSILNTGPNSISRWDYLLTQFRVERTYLRLLFFPLGQCFDYDYRLSSGWGDPDTWAAFSLLLSVFILSLAFFKKNRLLTFGVLWFFLTLSVESSLIPFPDLIFEHRLYLAMFGFVLFLTSLLWTLFRSVKWLTAVSLALVVILSGMTYSRNEVWKNPFTLWQDTVKKSPHKWRPYEYLGYTYDTELNDFKTALLYYNKALATGFYSPDLLANIAAVNDSLGKTKEKSYYQEQALAMAKAEARSSRTWDMLEYNRAFFLKNEGKTPEAIHALNKAIAIDPQNPSFQILLGNLYLGAGQTDAAIVSFRKAIDLAPLSREGYDALALLYKGQGNDREAVAVLVEYLKFKKKHKPLFGN